MDAGFIIPVLALITMLAGIVYAMWSKHVTDQELRDPSNPNSSLAVDGPSHRNEEERKQPVT